MKTLDKTKSRNKTTQLMQLAILYEIMHQLNSSLDLTKCLQKIIQEVARLLNVTKVSLMLLDEQNKELTIECAVGIDKEIVKNTRIKLEDSSNISSWIAQSGKPLLIVDIQKLKRFAHWESDNYFNNSLLSVPLKRKKRILGVLNVNNKKDASVFNREDLDFLTTLSNEFSLAIDNAQLYQKLIKTNEDLKNLHRTKTDFIDDISHSLRSPLSTAMYSVNIINSGGAGRVNPQQQHFLSLADDNLAYINRLINCFLELSRLQSGKRQLQKKNISISELLKKIVNSFQPLAKDKGITLRRKILNRNIQIPVDPDRIRDAFVNLIDNAIRFTRQGGKITIEASKKADFVKINVIDTGIGIPAYKIKKLFSRFHPGKAANPAESTFGLGLAISRSIIQLHGGEIYVESKKGKGSKFSFTLPC